MSTLGMLLSVLALLGTIGLVVLAAAVAIYQYVRGRRDVARRALILSGAVLGVYAAILIGVALASRDRVLPPGAEKYFCELDCHMAHVVTEAHAEAGAWLVTIRSRFDEKTISPRRPLDALLWPAPRLAAVVGSDGHRYPAEWPAAVPTDSKEGSGRLDRPLKPGESYLTVVRFVLPAGVTPSRLFLTDDIAVSRLLIGHERSLGHAAIYLPLPGAPVAGR